LKLTTALGHKQTSDSVAPYKASQCDDDELNEMIMKKVLDPTVTVVITLDRAKQVGSMKKHFSISTESTLWLHLIVILR
jgi:hypothetical protein